MTVTSHAVYSYYLYIHCRVLSYYLYIHCRVLKTRTRSRGRVHLTTYMSCVASSPLRTRVLAATGLALEPLARQIRQRGLGPHNL